MDQPEALSPEIASESPVERDDSIDVLKGFGISFVVMNHCFVRGLRNLMGVEVKDDLVMYAINRLIHFAVPLFLFVSALLLTRSVSRRFDLSKYSWSRFHKTVVPYLFFTGFYLIFRMVEHEEILTLESVFWSFATGKGYFHLYFTIVLVQVSILVPIIVKIVDRRQVPVWVWGVVAAILQLLAYDLQRRFWGIPNPGSTAIWYLVSLGLGIGMGLNRDESEQIGLKWLKWLMWAGVFATGYVYFSLGEFSSWRTSSDLINLTYVGFTVFFALSAWGWVRVWPLGGLRMYFRTLGFYSLPLFLIHPAVMFYLGGPRVRMVLSQLPGSLLVFYLLVLGVSFCLAWLAIRTPGLKWIFGVSSRG